MNGHGEKLTRKQDTAIGALLFQSTILAAAEFVGIGEATLRRWLKEPGFLTAYRAARRDTLEHCVALSRRRGATRWKPPWLWAEAITTSSAQAS